MMVINKYTVDELDSFYKAMKNGNRYVMLRGGTGTGKTMYAKELAWWLTHPDVVDKGLRVFPGMVEYGKLKKTSSYVSLENQEYYRLASEDRSDDQHILLIPFHKGRTYENTVYGLSLRTEGGKIAYNNTKQKFIEMCERANDNSEEKFVIILDDVNRSDLSRALGDVMQALESSGKNRSIPIDGETVKIPDNLYIIATANPTFGSSPDYAWLRRFLMFDIMPDERHITAPEFIRFRNLFENGNYFNESDYEKFLDYSYCIFMYVKIMYERYFADDDPVIKLQNCPGHGMFMLPYAEKQPFEEYVKRFHLKLKHIIVPFLRSALADGFLKNDEVVRFDILALDKLGEFEVQKKTDPPAEFSIKESIEYIKEGPGKKKENYQYMVFGNNKKRYIGGLKNSPFLSEDEDVRNAFVYLLLLRNPLIYRISVKNNKRCFLYENKEYRYCNSSSGQDKKKSEPGFHIKRDKEKKRISICGTEIFLYPPDTVNKSDNAPIAVSIGDGIKSGGDRNLSLIQIYYMYYRILRRALNYTDDTEGLESYLKKQKNYYY